jgi:hypothetical protein
VAGNPDIIEHLFCYRGADEPPREYSRAFLLPVFSSRANAGVALPQEETHLASLLAQSRSEMLSLKVEWSSIASMWSVHA